MKNSFGLGNEPSSGASSKKKEKKEEVK